LDCWLECYECGEEEEEAAAEEEEEAEFFRCFVAKLFKENESICTAASEEQEGRSFAVECIALHDKKLNLVTKTTFCSSTCFLAE
jgi:hypothetical protein